MQTDYGYRLKVSGGLMVKCPLCDKELAGVMGAVSHLRSKHKLTGQPSWDIQNKLFPKIAKKIQVYKDKENLKCLTQEQSINN